jgi:hypothetical protein
MMPLMQPRHDLSPNEIDAVEEYLDKHNRHATGLNDSRGLGFVARGTSNTSWMTCSREMPWALAWPSI